MLSLSHLTPLRLFRQGHGTDAIAQILGCSEATAERLVHDERDLERIRVQQIRAELRRRLEGMVHK